MATATQKFQKRKSKNASLMFQYYLFDKEITSQIGSIGFAILTYILLESRQSNDCSISITFIMDFLGIKNHAIVRKYLHTMQDLNLITIDVEDIDTVDKNKRLFIGLEKYYEISGGFRLIPAQIFLENYKYINPTAWLIFCTLSKLWHPDNRFTKISRQNLLSLVDLSSKKTLAKNVKLLEDLKLIEVTDKKTYYNTAKDKLGSEPNHYIIKYLFNE